MPQFAELTYRNLPFTDTTICRYFMPQSAATATPWKPRYLQKAVKTALNDTPVVCLLGARQTGKSSLVQEIDPDRTYLSLDEQNLLLAAREDPEGFVRQLPEKITIDEIQRAPELLLSIKRNVDSNRVPGKYLLTGSANLLQVPRLSDSLAGRMEILHLQPLSESEKEGAGGAFLENWLKGKLTPGMEFSESEDRPSLLERVIAGGYPEPQSRQPDRARKWYRQYLNSILERDIREVAQVKAAEDVGRLLELYANRSGTLINYSSVGKELGLDRETIGRYLAVLEKLFLIRRLPSWHQNKAKRLIKTPKLHLQDSGLATALSDFHLESWPDQREAFGHLVESFVIQQFMTLAAWTDPDLKFYHYRDRDQVEVDCIITRGRNVWGAEVKASATLKKSDGKGLVRLSQQAGKDFQGGIILYEGSRVLPLGTANLLGVPLSSLWML